MIMRSSGTVRALLVAVSLALTACASRERELERVAKDWCQTIRASQVVPVYPLTEDLQPGDVFLVETPIQQQAKVYRERGFLPLDQMVVRLHDLDYSDFYAAEYWDGLYAKAPHPRPIRIVTDGTKPPPFVTIEAPRAAFPSYTFEVRRGAGLKLAIPVQGVPIGFGMMRTDSATGSVEISDAYTYAAPPEAIYERLIRWASDPERQRVLADLQKKNDGHPLFLRVVQRVYLTGGVLVSLVNDAAGSAGLDVGAAQQVSVLDVATGKTTAENFAAASNALSSALRPAEIVTPQGVSGFVPGGSLRIVEATHRSVTLKENFDRPLVIGYLGYDFPILEGGVLGVPVATLTQLEETRPPTVRTTPLQYAVHNVDPPAQPLQARIATWLTADPTSRFPMLENYLAKKFGVTVPADTWVGSAGVEQLNDVINQFHVP
ncbi:MAG: hypothetical protein U0572_14555 [Phycisphaerales bacterium]